MGGRNEDHNGLFVCVFIDCQRNSLTYTNGWEKGNFTPGVVPKWEVDMSYM